jgi:LCP family protein required for cell wall assembly
MTHPFDSSNDAGREDFSERPRPVKKRRGRKVLIAVAAVLALVAVVAGGYLFNLAHTYDSGSSKLDQAFPDESTRPKKTDNSINILVMGSDSRGAAESDTAGTPADQRADTLMLMHIPADRKNIYTMSIMRDLWVDIPGHGEAKINSALALGGTPLMVQTVESVFQQRIDHVAMIDFEGFKGLTDALGGVTVNIKLPFTSTALPGQSFAPGQHTFNGTQALAFVRERHAYADGDYQRVRNQQEFLRAIIKKSTAGQTLSNPFTVNSMVGAVSPFVTVDKSLDSGAVAGLALELRDIRAQNTVMFTLPTGGTGTSADGQSIVLADPNAIQDISGAMARGTMGEYVAANKLENGN